MIIIFASILIENDGYKDTFFSYNNDNLFNKLKILMDSQDTTIDINKIFIKETDEGLILKVFSNINNYFLFHFPSEIEGECYVNNINYNNEIIYDFITLNFQNTLINKNISDNYLIFFLYQNKILSNYTNKELTEIRFIGYRKLNETYDIYFLSNSETSEYGHINRLRLGNSVDLRISNELLEDYQLYLNSNTIYVIKEDEICPILIETIFCKYNEDNIHIKLFAFNYNFEIIFDKSGKYYTTGTINNEENQYYIDINYSNNNIYFMFYTENQHIKPSKIILANSKINIFISQDKIITFTRNNFIDNHKYFFYILILLALLITLIIKYGHLMICSTFKILKTKS